MLPTIIIAGGLATRLKPLSDSIPKSLISIQNKPFIVHQIEYLQSQGIVDVVICVGNLGKLIQTEVGDGSRYGLNIKYSFDGDSLLGTGGCVKKASSLIKGDFFVLYGDSYLPINYKEVLNSFSKSKKLALMTVFRNDNKLDRSNVIFSKGEIIKYDKLALDKNMLHIDYGLSIMSTEIFLRYNLSSPFDLSKIFTKLLEEKELTGHEVFTRFYEIGSHLGIKDLESYFLRR